MSTILELLRQSEFQWLQPNNGTMPTPAKIKKQKQLTTVVYRERHKERFFL